MTARHSAPERFPLAEKSLEEDDQDDNDSECNEGHNVVRCLS